MKYKKNNKRLFSWGLCARLFLGCDQLLGNQQRFHEATYE